VPRPDQPPPQDFFDEPRTAAGSQRVALRLDPLAIEIEALDAELADLLFERYSPYASRDVAPSGALRVRLARENTDYFIDPRPGSMERVQLRIACDGDRVRYLSYQVAGWFDVGTGRGDLLLARGTFEPPLRAIENYVRVAVAWLAAARGGALVHAASAIWKDKGYLFYGESGAGKSTLSACNRRARIVSDDLSLVLPDDDGRLEVIGSPFRGTYEDGPAVRGRFPLAAGFRLIQAPTAQVRPVDQRQALAELVGNLPFVAEAFDARPDLFEQTLRVFSGLPLAHLHFSKDDSYWDAIDSAGY
jgi:hypothetical protein